MIIKSYEISKKKVDNFKFFLFYGENQGYKEESIKLIVKKMKLLVIIMKMKFLIM